MLAKIFIFVLTVFALSAQGESLEYFSDGIEYWKLESSQTKSYSKKRINKTKTKGEVRKQFNWSKYLNPKNDEFFKEGNYTPPAPFMELARRPTDVNIKRWIHYNELKNKLSNRLNQRMKIYLAKNSPKSSRAALQIIEQSSQKRQKVKIDPSQYRVRMYFDSKCPHCKSMFNTLTSLQNIGIYVEALQIDNAKIDSLKYPIVIQRATKSDIKKHNIKGVPFTLIANLKKKILYPAIQGYQSVNSILSIIQKGETL